MNMVRVWLALCIFLFCASPTYAATCAPKSLVHIVTVDVTPGIDPASFGAQPRSFYRIGSDKTRIEEAVDSANHIHGLIVVAEPNIWMVNLYDNSGKHIVDPGPTFNSIVPLFGMSGLPAKLASLELGCEAEWIAANAPTPTRSEQVGATRYDVYHVDAGSDATEVLERAGTNTPVFARYFHEGKLVIAIRYDLYSTGLINNPNLFTAPPGVRYVEAQ